MHQADVSFKSNVHCSKTVILCLLQAIQITQQIFRCSICCHQHWRLHSPFLFKLTQTSNWFSLYDSKSGLASWKERKMKKWKKASHIRQWAFTLIHIRLYAESKTHCEQSFSNNLITFFLFMKSKSAHYHQGHSVSCMSRCVCLCVACVFQLMLYFSIALNKYKWGGWQLTLQWESHLSN